MKQRLELELLIQISNQRVTPWWFSIPPQKNDSGFIPHIMSPFYGWDDLPVKIAAEVSHLG